jgi:cyclohexadienyl dehydratase
MRTLILLAGLAAGLAIPLQPLAAEPLANRLERVKADKVVRVCIWPDYYGITYRKPQNPAAGSGIDIDNGPCPRPVDLGVAVPLRRQLLRQAGR